MDFDTKYSRSAKNKEFISNSGLPYLDVYEYRYDDKGVKELVIVGKEDIFGMIQSSKDSVDINVLLSKFINGDETALNRVKGIYMDVSDMPTTYAELFDRNEQCKSLFEQLPVDIKEKFNNSYTEFWSCYGSDAFMNIVNPVEKDVDNVDKKESEVV